MFVNVQLAVQLNQAEAFLDNWRFDQDGNRLGSDFAPYQTNPETPAIDVYQLSDVRPLLTAQGLWKNNTQGAAQNHKQLVNIKVRDVTELDWTDPQDPDPKTILTIVHYLRETFPGSIQVLDVFKKDGFRHGQHGVFDEDGNLVSTEGQPTYLPVNKNEMMNYMHSGTDYEQVVVSQGWANRRYE